MRKPKVLMVEWKDAAYDSFSGMQRPEQLAGEGITLVNVGFLTKETEEAVVLSTEWDGDERDPAFRHHHTILKNCIKKRRVIK